MQHAPEMLHTQTAKSNGLHTRHPLFCVMVRVKRWRPVEGGDSRLPEAEAWEAVAGKLSSAVLNYVCQSISAVLARIQSGYF